MVLRELGELKQLSSRRKRDNIVISQVAASEREGAQTQIVFRLSGLIYQAVLIFKQVNWGYGKSTDLRDQKSYKLFLQKKTPGKARRRE